MKKRLWVSAAVALVTVPAAYGLVGVAPGEMGMGPIGRLEVPSFTGYYDGHKDRFLSTDVSSRSAARMEKINFSARIGKVKGLPEIYIVEGRAAAGQLPVFGSEPGEPDYSPLWDETILTWKPGSTNERGTLGCSHHRPHRPGPFPAGDEEDPKCCRLGDQQPERTHGGGRLTIWHPDRVRVARRAPRRPEHRGRVSSLPQWSAR